MIPKYKLSEILQIVAKGFNQLFYDFDFWFESEVSRISVINNNAYLELIEFGEGQKVTGKAKGTIFDTTVYYNFLKKIQIKSIEDLKGYKLFMKGRLQFHPEYGFSIAINEISAEHTLGQLQAKQNTIVDELKKLGIYDENRKKDLGFPPYSIAVISSETSQGLKDFLTVLNQSDFNLTFSSYYCSIHGNEAIKEVYDQLKKIYADIANGAKIDVVAIIRGGGGSSGIIWQNDINIAKGICHMPVPVMIAVGHTADKFILDEISRFSAKTPTDAAYMIIERMNAWMKDIDTLRQEIDNQVKNRREIIKKEVDKLSENIRLTSEKLIENIKSDIEMFYTNIMSFSPERMKNYGYGILADVNGKYLDKQAIDNLNAGDEMMVKVYNKDIRVKII